MTTTWSKLGGHKLAQYALDTLLCNSRAGCTYHNIDHVSDMYKFLEETHEPYDEALDWAVLFHDLVYDAQPEKEFRSAQLWRSASFKYRELDAIRVKVYDLILLTVDHKVGPHELDPSASAIVRADLSGLSHRDSTFCNYAKILQESVNLYKSPAIDFANGNILFMLGLSERVKNNIQTDPIHRDFYKKVLLGIEQTVNLSIIISGLKP